MLKTIAKTVAWVTVLGAMFALGIMQSAEIHAPRVPTACTHPTLPSGDAARLNGRTYVCTDGSWVPVARYGS
jgi:hypothetical protein